MIRISKKVEKKHLTKSKTSYQSLSITKPINAINNVFEILRNQIPTFPYERRLSKIDTLNITISYINLLKSIIDSNHSLFDYLIMVLNSNPPNQVSWANSGNFFVYIFLRINLSVVVLKI